MMIAVGVLAASTAAQAGTINLSLTETAPGNWELAASVSGGDTAGLASFSATVFTDDPSAVSATFPNLSTISPLGAQQGFQTSSVQAFASSVVAGAAMTDTNNLITGVGMSPVNVAPAFPIAGQEPVVFGVPAVLMTLTTPEGLASDSFAFNAGLLNANGDGFLPADSTTISSTVEPIPEPTTAALLGLTGLLMARRRRA
jgi:hypothetical protein